MVHAKFKRLEGKFMLAFGTGSTWRKEDPESGNEHLVEVVKNALESGYRHLDTAELYNTEKEVGEAIRQSGVPVSEIYITAKVVSVNNIRGAFDRTLARLGVDYVDIYLLHHPYFAKSPTELQTAWADMEAVHDMGKVGAIGVSNCTREHIETILEKARIPPALNQVELNPYLQRTGLQNFHNTHNIQTMAFSPLSPIVRASPGPLDDVLAGIAHTHGLSTAVILVRWALQEQIAVVTTSTRLDRMKDHLGALDATLTDDEMEVITRVGSQKHFRGRWNDKFSADDTS